MNNQFRQSILVLRQTNADLAQGYTTAVAHAHAREAALSAALFYMAKTFGIQLQLPLTIDACGELRLVSLAPDNNPALGCAPFGAAYTAWLNTARPRTGTASATLCPQNGWCILNHFQAEQMVLNFFEVNTTKKAPAPAMPE